MLRLVRLERLGDRLPRQLSGGQQQRVALTPSAFAPMCCCSTSRSRNLDAKLRQEVRVEIRELQRKLALTTVMVTHDQEEALTMADRLVVMHDGAVRQVGTQQDLYERPIDRFVAGFVGRSTFLEGEMEAPGRFRSVGGLALACRAATASGPATLALRPERITLAATPQGDMDNNLPGVVEFVSYLGAAVDLHVRISALERVVVQIANATGSPTPKVGDRVHVAWPAANGLLFAGIGA